MQTTPDNAIFSTPILHGETSKGGVKYWQGHVVQEGDRYFTQNSWWQETKDGLSKIQFSAPVEVFGLNTGKSNETTPRSQAFLNIQSDFTRYKQRERYLEEGEVPTSFTAPMLAKVYKDRQKFIDWSKGNYAQPKKDGCRFMMNSITAWSRKGVEFHPEVVKQFMFDTAGYTLDGELMLPPQYSQQQLMSAASTVGKKLSPLLDQLEFHVFDIVEPDLPFPERLVLLKEIVKNAPSHLKITILETHYVANEAEFLELHTIWSARGDEGSILRDSVSGYTGHRSSSLVKHKDFIDEEFRIIDVQEGKGLFLGKAVFKCMTAAGKEFDVAPKGNMASKAEMFQKRLEYIGKELTVRFQKYSDKGAPIFPVGIGIRNRDVQG